MAVFKMPSLGADMEDGKLVEWLVHPGDTVKRGDVVAVVETQKGAIEIEVFEDGVVERIEAALGQTLPVGAPLAVIRGAGEAAQPEPETPVEAPQVPEPADKAKPAAAPAPSPEPVTVPASEPVAAPTPAPPPGDGTVAASPAARVRAREAGIDLAGLSGSGPGGAVLLRDVEELAAGAPKPGKQGLDLEAMRVAIAAAMTRAKREIPHYYLDHEIDLQRAQEWMDAHNAGAPPDERLVMGALLVRAVALAAGKEKALNGHYDSGGYKPSTMVNAGVAVALRGGGLIAPAIMDAGNKTLGEVMAAMRDLVLRARAGRLKGSEMTEGTITVSSLGENGVDGMIGVIYPPQVALVGFGSPRPVPRVVDGSVTPRICVKAALSGDHRASDGRTGARFLSRIDQLLQEPEAL